MNARISTLRIANAFYLVVTSGDDEFDVVRATGFTIEQFVANLLARVSYQLGSRDGRFEGSVFNDFMPLCEADHEWIEASPPGIRTWCTDRGGFRLFPLTLGDLFVVMHCGQPSSYLERGGPLFAAMSQGRDGIQFQDADAAEAVVMEILQRSGMPIDTQSEDLREYVDERGNLTF